MSKTYKTGEIHQFSVIDIKEINDQKYIMLSDGYRDTYRVMPFDFQIEWEPYRFPKTLNCFVKYADQRGLPFLHQHRKSLLESLFQEATVHTFQVSSVNNDEQTGHVFLNLLDEFGLKHRFYPQSAAQVFEIGQELELTVEGVEETDSLINKAHLNLGNRFIDDSHSPTLDQNADLEIIETPRNEEDEEVLAIIEEAEFLGEENSICEFKTTIVYVPGTGRKPDIDQQIVFILKTIAGFLNAKGGKLYIGVNDSGFITGIEADLPYLNSGEADIFDYKANTDHYELKIRNNVKYYLGTRANAKLEFQFLKSKTNLIYCEIDIKKSEIPVLLSGNKLFQRTGNMTQLLKGDDLRTFIENRFLERFKSNFDTTEIRTVQTQEKEVVDDLIDVLTDPKELQKTPLAVEKDKKSDSKTWYYITFYRDGGWSFQKHAVNNPDTVLHEVNVTTDLKKGRLLQMYDNGCVNVITPYDLIKPSKTNGRKLKKEGNRYKNGWNTEANLLKVGLVDEYGLIGIESKIAGIDYLKIHNVTDITPKDTPHLKGNVLLNIELLNASLVNYKVLSNEDRFLVSELIVKRHHRSATAGFKKSNQSKQSRIMNYEQLDCRAESTANN